MTTIGLREHEIRALAVLYQGDRAGDLLDRAGLPRNRHPQAAPTAMDYWRQVGRELDGGILADGRGRIFGHALDDYPENPVFRAACRDEHPPGAPLTDEPAGRPRNAPPADDNRRPSSERPVVTASEVNISSHGGGDIILGGQNSKTIHNGPRTVHSARTSPGRTRPAPSSAPTPRGSGDLLVLTAPLHEAWGEWVGRRLRSAGYRVHRHTWDAGPGTELDDSLLVAARVADRIVVVLATDGPGGATSSLPRRLLAELARIFPGDEVRRRLFGVRVTDTPSFDPLPTMTCVDLFGLRASVATDRLLARLKDSFDV
jgi:hypothetical protein